MKNILSFLLLVAALASTSSSVAKAGEFADSGISVGVVVSDLEKSVKFYTEVVGMKRTGGFDVPPEFSKKSGLTDGTPLSVVVLKVEDTPSAPSWKLMTFGDKAKSQRSRYIMDHTGVQYITLNVTDLTPFVARIKKHNVKLLGETPVPLGGDKQFVLIQDPDGTFVELIGPMK
jgi:catechol 2,3-dioxygenase-like lactoylglutathione lyase family enzyme